MVFFVVAVIGSPWSAGAFEVETTLMGVDTWDWALFTTANSDLPDAIVTSLAAGPRGSVWIGTAGGGLAQLHKGRWQVFDSGNSPLPDDDVSALTTDGDGGIWIGTGGGLARLHDGDWQVFNPQNSPLPHPSVRALAVGREGGVWIATGNGLARVRHGNWQVFDSRNSPLRPHASIRALAIGRKGGLWIGTGDGLVRLHDESWQVFNSQNSPLPSPSVSMLAVGRDGSIWIGTSLGALARFHDESWQVFHPQPHRSPGSRFVALTTDREGDIWAGAILGGLTRLHDGEWEVLDPENSPLPHENVLGLVTGRDGEIWVGTAGGLVRIQRGPWKVFEEGNSPLPGEPNTLLLQDSEQLWIGTFRGGLARFHDGQWQIFDLRNSALPDWDVRALAVGRGGELWIGTAGGGLARVRDDNWRVFTPQKVWSLAADLDGGMWIGTASGLERRHEGRRQLFYAHNSPLPDPWVRALAMRDDELWIGTDGGLARLQDGRWQTFDSRNSPLPNDEIRALATHEDELWIGTNGGGLVRRRNGRWQVFSPRNSPLPNPYVEALAVGHDGAVWVGTTSGLGQLHDDHWHVFSSNNSPLPGNIVRALAAGPGGAIWIGTPSRLAKFRPGHRPVELALIGQREEIGQEEHIFAARAFDPNYRSTPGMFRYRWSLERDSVLGSGETVSAVTTRSPFFSATDLRDGPYELRVVALDPNGFRSNEVTTRFRVALPEEEAGWLRTTLLSVGSSVALYAVLILPVLVLYSRSSVARTALNSGVFTKFPWFHKAVLNTGWARGQIFRSLADWSTEKAEVPGTYLPQAIFPIARRDREPTHIDSSPRSLDALFGDQTPARALVLGRSGTGKSVLLQFLWRETGRRFLEGRSDLVPVFVDLRGYPLHDEKIEDLLRDTLRGAKVELPDDILDFLIRKGGFLLIVDSLNELPDPEKDAAAFHPFFQRDSDNAVVLASQVDVLGRQDLALWRLAEVTPEQARDYLRKEVGRDVWDELPRAARDLARNPQDLALLAEVASTLGAEEVPTARAALYREMLHQDSALAAWVDSADRRLDLIYGLALRMVEEQRLLDETRLVEWLDAEIERAGIDADAREVTEKIRASRLFRQESERGVLGREEPVVTFRHELIGKFLASRRLRRELERDEDVEAIVDRAGDELWIEVFTILLDELDSREILNRFLERLVYAGGAARLRLVAHTLATRQDEVKPEVRESYLQAKVSEDVEDGPRT